MNTGHIRYYSQAHFQFRKVFASYDKKCCIYGCNGDFNVDTLHK